MCCSVLQCVAVCCSAWQCIAVRCSALPCVAVCYSVTSVEIEGTLDHFRTELFIWFASLPRVEIFDQRFDLQPAVAAAAETSASELG